MLLIFDWDGTLSDSAGKIVRCMQAASISAGFHELSEESILNIIGLGLPEAMQSLYPNLNEEQKEQIRQEYIRHFLASDQEASPFFDGVVAGLSQLKKLGFQMAVATGKSRQGLDRVLKLTNMQQFFDGSRCADETVSKPHPMMLNELLLDFNKLPHQAVMVGDTEYDMEMARLAGVQRVAVSYGAHHISRLHAYDPVLCVNHFSEFVDWVATESNPS